jgi:SAM-dependent methyltransferase
MRSAEANRLFYAQIAKDYATRVTCLPGSEDHDKLAGVLDYALPLLPRDAAVLDACGGSGNASLALRARGVETTLVDVSPDMIAIYRRQAGEDADVVEAEIEPFLADDGREWDMIVFSSALHHLEEPELTARAAARRLAPGGLLVTVYDPRRTSQIGYVLRRFDYMANEVIKRPSGALKKAREKLTKRDAAAGPAIGFLAERWANMGLDDEAICAALVDEGCEILRHDLYFGGRLWPTRLIARAARLPWNFSLVARRH